MLLISNAGGGSRLAFNVAPKEVRRHRSCPRTSSRCWPRFVHPFLIFLQPFFKKCVECCMRIGMFCQSYLQRAWTLAKIFQGCFLTGVGWGGCAGGRSVVLKFFRFICSSHPGKSLLSFCSSCKLTMACQIDHYKEFLLSSSNWYNM